MLATSDKNYHQSAMTKFYSKETKDEGNKMQHEGKSSDQAQRDDPSLDQGTSFQEFYRSELGPAVLQLTAL
jgi:hypothetical protein